LQKISPRQSTFSIGLTNSSLHLRENLRSCRTTNSMLTLGSLIQTFSEEHGSQSMSGSQSGSLSQHQVTSLTLILFTLNLKRSAKTFPN
jgi:hypothetical protein